MKATAAILVILSLLLASYVGAYYMTVGQWAMNGPRRSFWLPQYSVGGEWAQTFFSPMHEIDLRLRPDHWGFNP